jgi:hypothetical protein
MDALEAFEVQRGAGEEVTLTLLGCRQSGGATEFEVNMDGDMVFELASRLLDAVTTDPDYFKNLLALVEAKTERLTRNQGRAERMRKVLADDGNGSAAPTQEQERRRR